MLLLQGCKPSLNFQKHSFHQPLTLFGLQCTVVEAEKLDIAVVLGSVRMLQMPQFVYTLK